MSHTVVVALGTTPTAFPAAIIPGGIVVTLVGTAATFISQTVKLVAAPYVASFADVAGGDTYTITSQAIDDNGAALGDAVVVTQVIAADAPATINVDIPTSAAVTVL